MSHLDYIIIGIVLLSSIFGYTRGLVREAFALGSWVIAFLFGFWFGPELASAYPDLLGSGQVAQIAAFLIVLVATLMVASMIQWGLGQLVNRTGVGGTDRLLGFLFGAARGGLLVTVVLMVGQSFFAHTNWWNDSELKYGFLQFEDEVLILLDLASDSLDDPPPAPTLPDIDFYDTQPPDIEVIDDLDSSDYFEE
ncbi:MAG: CvpA family protein [Pseudomonadales bacterium]|jgi:membrane protein required for colicin V production|nr:CvpA family protein [Pseudomonadales bacterium]